MIASEKNIMFIKMLAQIDFNDRTKCPYLASYEEIFGETGFTSPQNKSDYVMFLLGAWNNWWKSRKKWHNLEFKKVIPEDDFKKITS